MTIPHTPQGRLYLALYKRDDYRPSIFEKDDRYHWALLAIPSSVTSSAKTTKATRVHARDYYSSPDQTHWIYEEIRVDAAGTPKLLAQILVSDIVDMERLFELLRDLPIVQDQKEWNCISWLRSAFTAMEDETEVVKWSSSEHSWMSLRNSALATADATTIERSTKGGTTEPFTWEIDV
jgi:hypothetical protein